MISKRDVRVDGEYRSNFGFPLSADSNTVDINNGSIIS